MSRIEFVSLLVLFLFASLCASRTAAPTMPAAQEHTDTQNSAATEEGSHPASIAPEVAVPGAKGGKDEAGRTVPPITATETQAPPLAPTADQQEFAINVKDVFFDFDRWVLTPDDRNMLQQDAEWLKTHPDMMFTIAGQADPRGSIWYNLFISDQRAIATRDALLQMGVSPKQIVFAEGWGKLYAVCQQEDESCWSQDRRAHFAAWSPNAGPLTGKEAVVTGEE